MAGIPQIPVEELKLGDDCVPLISCAAGKQLPSKNSQDRKSVV